MDAAGRLSGLRVEFPFFFLGVAAIPTSLQIIGTGVACVAQEEESRCNLAHTICRGIGLPNLGSRVHSQLL